MYKYVFGPVISRRLGLSLGVDLLPMKTCSLNCAYCECGVTTNLTIERKEYVPTEDVCKEIVTYLEQCSEFPDYITFSGSGEPTLHSGIGEIIGFIKEHYPHLKIALLTNSTLLTDAGLRKEIAECDLIVPSIDAVSKEVFNKIFQPHSDLSAETVIEGVKLLRSEYMNNLVIEFFVIPGVNDTNNELSLLRKAFEEIAPDAIQINYLDRPSSYKWVKRPSEESLNKIFTFFEGLPIQLVKRVDYMVKNGEGSKLLQQKLLSTIGRRPSTLDDLMIIVGLSKADLEIVLDQYVKDGLLHIQQGERGLFYCKS